MRQASARKSALACAYPNEGVHIELFVDRLTENDHLGQSRYMGYVMAHEITHILQGVARHSDAGVMKAAWTLAENRQISFLQLGFDPEDIQLIQAGMEKRTTARVLASR